MKKLTIILILALLSGCMCNSSRIVKNKPDVLERLKVLEQKVDRIERKTGLSKKG